MSRSASLAALCEPQFSVGRLIAAGMSEVEAVAKGKRFAQCARTLIQDGHAPNETAVTAFVPGRIEVLGKHTDYCGGRSLLCTVERGMCFVGIARADAKTRFFAIDLNESADFRIERDVQPTPRHWSNYPMTVARRISRNFGAAIGADIAMSSDLPPASGLSSSSAMIVGCFMIYSVINALELRDAYRHNIQNTLDLAGYLGCIENGQSFGTLAGDKGVGTFGGSQDHTAILCCQPGKLSVFSFCPVRFERQIDLHNDLCFVVADSRIVAEKTGDALQKYNDVSDRVRRIVAMWNRSDAQPVACLHDAIASSAPAPERLRSIIFRETADDTNERYSLLSRLEQFMVESDQLIPLAIDALAAEDWDTFHSVVNRSQAGAVEGLQNQVPQTIELQQMLLRSGAIAASAFGAGFGGSVWGLFKYADLKPIAGSTRSFPTRPGCCAMFID